MEEKFAKSRALAVTDAEKKLTELVVATLNGLTAQLDELITNTAIPVESMPLMARDFLDKSDLVSLIVTSQSSIHFKVDAIRALHKLWIGPWVWPREEN